jgi:hypothetical protein
MVYSCILVEIRVWDAWMPMIEAELELKIAQHPSSTSEEWEA